MTIWNKLIIFCVWGGDRANILTNRSCRGDAVFNQFFLSDYKDMVLAPCKLKQIREMIMWQFAIISGLLHFYGRISGYVVIYWDKDKNTTQGNLVELVGSPVAPSWCK